MTDDEISKLLKRPTPWREYVLFALAVLGAGAALGKWVFTAPTREEYVQLKNDTDAVKTDHAVLKAKVDGMRDDLAEVKNGQKAFQIEIKADIGRLLDRRR